MGEQTQFFRANAGIVVVNQEGEVLALERSDVPGAWQLPQGGIKDHEEPIATAKRELTEETSIRPEDLQFLAEYPEWIAYELPEEARSEKTGRGQVQKWFFFQTRGQDGPAIILNTEDGEFRAFKWISLSQLASEVVAFRRPAYVKLADFLNQRLQ